MALMLNQYSKEEIEEFVWANAGIHVTDWSADTEKQVCEMDTAEIEYRSGTRRILSKWDGASDRLEQFTSYCEKRANANSQNSKARPCEKSEYSKSAQWRNPERSVQ